MPAPSRSVLILIFEGRGGNGLGLYWYSLGRFPGPCMLQAATYNANETLRNGKRILIRALTPKDRDGFIAVAGTLSPESLRRRFFCVKKQFSEAEQNYFLNPDFINHVALVGLVEEACEIAGGGRYVVFEPGEAELAFAVADKYQGQGVGPAIMRHLVVIARAAGLRKLTAQVLPENIAMLEVMKSSGLPATTKLESGAVNITLQLT
jgi:RimJ/RimL family protein N-acetyltransferase